MTNLPPPQPPGYQPQQPSYDPGGGSAYTPQPFVPAPQPPSQGKQRNKKALFLGVGALVIVALGVGGFLILNKDDKKSDAGGTFDIKTAKRNVNDIIDAAGVEGGTTQTLPRCPMGDPDDIAEKSPVDFDAVDVARGTESALAGSSAKGNPSFVECFVVDKKQKNFFALFASDAPKGDFTKFVKSSFDTFDIKFEKTSKFRGGTVQPYCGTPKKGNDGQAFCEADWSDGTFAVGVAISGRDITPEIATAFLEAELPDLVSTLDGDNADDFPPVTSPA